MSSESKNSNEIENDTNLSSKRNINKNIEKQQISTGDEHLKTESKNPSNQFSKRKKIIIITISISLLLIIAALILIIGHFKFDWFTKKK